MELLTNTCVTYGYAKAVTNERLAIVIVLRLAATTYYWATAKTVYRRNEGFLPDHAASDIPPECMC